MAVTRLIDTRVATRLARPAVRDALLEMVAVQSVGRTWITDLEVGFSARHTDEWDALAQALAVLPLVPRLDDDLRRAGRVQRSLAGMLTMLHYDADFDLIASVTGLHCQWVVPRGLID